MSHRGTLRAARQRRAAAGDLSIWGLFGGLLFPMLLKEEILEALGAAVYLAPLGLWWVSFVAMIWIQEPRYRHRKFKARHEATEVDLESVTMRGYSPKFPRLLPGQRDG